MKLYWLYSTLLVLCSSLSAQHPIDSRPYALLYSISTHEVVKYYHSGDEDKLIASAVSKPPIDTAWLDEKPARYIPRDSGNYLVLWGRAPELSFYLVHNHPFGMNSMASGKDALIYLYNRFTLEPVKDAVIHAGDENVTYSEEKGGYRIYVRRDQEILIERGKDLWATNLRRYKEYQNNFLRYPLRNTWYLLKRLFTSQRIYYGYVAINKPRYRVGDSLHFKFMAMDRKGRGLGLDDVDLKLSYYDYKSHSIKEKAIIELKELGKGTFTGSFSIVDSLDGKRLTLKLEPRGNFRSQLRTSFQVEDYRVKEIDFEAEVLNQDDRFAKNIPLKLRLSAFTQNGLPVLDGRVNIKIKTLQHFFYSTKDIVLVPNTLLDTSFYLDPAGEQVFSLPREYLPEADLRLHMTVELLNSDNEYHNFTHNLNYLNRELVVLTEETEEGFWITTVDSSVAVQEVSLIGRHQASNSSPQFFKFSDSTLFRKKLKLPHFEKWNPAVDFYKIYHGEHLEKTITPEVKRVQPVYWLADEKVYLSFPNAQKQPVRYEVFMEDAKQSFRQGVARDDTIHFTAPVADYLVVRYLSLDAPSDYINTLFVVINEDLIEDPVIYLDAGLKGPAHIHPGDSANFQLQVKDAEGNAYKDLNILALSVKKAFEEEPLEEVVPYPQYKKTLKHKQKFSLELDRDVRSRTAPLQKEAYEKLNLRQQDAFRFYFRKKGVITDTFKASENLGFGQFAAFVFDSLHQKNVYAIYANGRPIYAHHLYTQAFSFPLKPGLYTISIRGRDFRVNVPGVRVFPNTKTELAVNLARLPDSVLYEDMPVYFTKDEYRELVEHTLYFTNPLHMSFYFQQGNKWVAPFNHRSVYEAGPFEKGEAIYWDPKTDSLNFFFEPGRSYRFHPNVVYSQPVDVSYSKQKFPYALTQIPGEKLPPKPGIQKTFSFPEVNELVPELKGIDAGSMKLHKLVNAGFMYYQFYHYEMDSLYYGRKKFRGLSYWPEGTYRLHAYTYNLRAVQIDSISIKSGYQTHVYIRPKHWLILDSDSLRNAHLKLADAAIPTEISVQGTIVSAQSGESIPFANVVIKSHEGVIITGTVTDFDGFFRLPKLAAGSYKMTVSFVGHASVTQTIEVTENSVAHLQISLPEQSEELEAVVITYSAPLVDKTKSALITTSEDIVNMAVRDISSVSSRAAGVVRSNSNVFFIDGVKIRGDLDLPQAAIATSEVITAGLPPHYGDAGGGIIGVDTGGRNPAEKMSRANSTLAALNKKGGGLRNNFADYAFFIPDVSTDENGEAVVNVEFPDDMTAWETTFVGMDEGFRYFKRKALTTSYSEVVARLAVPFYLREGDSCVIVGKTLNYLDTALQVQNRFKVNKTTFFDTTRNLTSVLVDRLPVKADSSSMVLEYNMQLEGGYLDGEKREVRVQKPGINISTGSFVKISSDTSIRIKNEAENEYFFSLMNGSEAVLLELSEQLVRYPYACNEQLSSRLKALLAQKQILEKRGEKFRQNLEVKRIIDKLVEGMNASHLWGWWPEQPTDVFMTVYVLQTLREAEDLGYDLPPMFHTERKLQDMLLDLEPSERLSVLYYLSQQEKSAAYSYFTRGLNWDSLRTSEKLKLSIISEQQKLPYRSAKTENLMKTDIFGNLYVPEDGTFSLMGEVSNSLLMGEWLRIKGITDTLQSLRDHVLMSASLSELNTIEKAAAIHLLFHSDSTIPAQTSYQFNSLQSRLEPGKQVTMTSKAKEIQLDISTSETVYLSYWHGVFIPNPEKDSTHFDISTQWLDEAQEPVDNLTDGKVYNLRISVDAARKAEYVMLKIPKPAGTIYQSENSFYSSHYIENKRDHLSLYINRMKEGENTFDVKLMPRFEGRFRLDPTQVELMYFPVFNGNDKAKDVQVN